MYVKDDRNFITFLILNFITCGIYGIYFWYMYVEDINTVFYGDGEDSPNYILVLILSIITCGIAELMTATVCRSMKPEPAFSSG